jgi:PKD repeat protein
MRNKSFLRQNTFQKYLLFLAFVPLFLLNSCEKDYGKEPETTKELMATVSANKAVAGGDTLTFIDLSLGVETRTWSFPGGKPATSDKPEIGVVFGEEGNIAPSLVITYFDGSKDSMSFPIKIFPVLIADFKASATKIKVGETVKFTDTSVGGATAWNWEFEGGTPATSTAQNPTVQFNVNKPVSIKLQITRAEDGSKASVTKDDLVQVGPPELMMNGNFENGAIVGWQTWNGSGFPYAVEAGGANGTTNTSYFNFKGSWGWAQLISRDKPPVMTISLVNGRDYTISLYVKAAAAGIASLNTLRLVNHLPEWSSSLGGREPEGYSEYYPISGSSIPVALTTEWQLVSVVVSIPDDGKTRSNAFPDIIFGGASDVKISIDEVSIKIVE